MLLVFLFLLSVQRGAGVVHHYPDFEFHRRQKLIASENADDFDQGDFGFLRGGLLYIKLNMTQNVSIYPIFPENC